MSDRKRRWICRLFFLVACLMPTGWLIMRVAFQPSATQWSAELELALGLPLDVGRVQTPNAREIHLHQLTWDHPESGRVAELNRIEIHQTQVPASEVRKWHQSSVLPTQRWIIPRLELPQAALPDFLQTLHQQWFLRQRLTTLPEIQIQELVVTDPAPSRAAGASSRPALRLEQVVIRTEQPSPLSAESPTWPTLMILGKVLPLVRGPVVGMEEAPELAVPFALRIERQKHDSDFQTHWFLTLDKPLPVRALNLNGIPPILSARNLRVSGKFLGWADSRQWGFQLVDAHIWGDPAQFPLSGGFDLADLVDWVQGRASRSNALLIDGEAKLKISQAHIQATWNHRPELVSLDASLQADNGGISSSFLSALQQALRYEPQSPGRLPQVTRFDRLGVRILAGHGRLRLEALPNANNQRTLMQYGDEVLLQATETDFHLSDFYRTAGLNQGTFDQLSSLLPSVTWPTSLEQDSALRQALYQAPDDSFLPGRRPVVPIPENGTVTQ